MKLEEFDYHLPQELIAQKPSEKRDQCRLMVVDRKNHTVDHKRFCDILDYLDPSDCLVMNNSKVLPARLFGEKAATGARVEFLLTRHLEGDCWETMVRPGKRLKPGDSVVFGDNFCADILDYGEDGTRIVRFRYEGIFMERLEELGKMPPTAGLHFTEELLDKAEKKGIRLAYVTLHVGIGTFRPVKCENIEDHHMHFEEYYISEETAKTINDTIRSGGRIVSVGTTSTRTLESAAYADAESGKNLVRPGSGRTDIFIYPGYSFKIIDALITNFHLPKSTLMMLISAFYDREHILAAYKEAVAERYRFFSYGDAMLITGEKDSQ